MYINVATTQNFFLQKDHYIAIFFVISIGYIDPQNTDKPTNHCDCILQTNTRDFTRMEIRKQHN